MSRIIAFEGIDGSGKTTQIKQLQAFLESKGYNVTSIAFPDRTTPIGELIDKILRNHKDVSPTALAYLFTANRWEHYKTITDAEARGDFVLLDRYIYSGVAYAMASDVDENITRGLSKGLPLPNVVIYLDLPPNKSRTNTKELFETQHTLTKVAQAYEKIRNSTWETIDAKDDISVVTKHIVTVVSNLYKL